MNLYKPKTWQKKTLEEVLEFVTGGDWGKEETYADSNYTLAYCIRGSEIKKWEVEKGKTASLRKIKKSSIETRKLKEGDILVEISGGGPDQPVGRTVLVDKTTLSFEPKIPKICTNFLRLIRPINEINSKFLNLYLKLFYYSGEITNYQGGSNNLRNLKFPDFVKIEIPLPPLPEQHRIVAKIEELFSDLDNGIENLKTAQQQLKTYRQAVLKYAFEGRFTNKKVKDGELPEGWKQATFGQVVNEFVRGPFGSSLKKEYFVPSGYKIYEQKNAIYQSIELGRYFVNESKYREMLRFEVKPADYIVSCSGTIGKLYKIPDNAPEGLINQALLIIRIDRKLLSDKYFSHLFQSEGFQRLIIKDAKGTAMLNLAGVKDLKLVPMLLPPLKEQFSIVEEIESRLSVCDKVEETITASLQQSESLRQSILKKAFEGKLD